MNVISTDIAFNRRWLALFAVLALAGCVSADREQPDVFQRGHPESVRMLSWNVKRNSIFPPDGERHAAFWRILRAVDPDVIALQEIMRDDQATAVVTLMNTILPLPDLSWHVHAVSDNVIISRFPLYQTGGLAVVPYPFPELGLPDFSFGFAAAMVDLPSSFGHSDLFLIAMHNKSGGYDEQVRLRQVQSDATVSWLRDLRSPAGPERLERGTPLIIAGDMNVVPRASDQPLETLLSGDIFDEDTFGQDLHIDWDGTALADAAPSHNSLNQDYYTWRNDSTPFPPSALDRVLYSDSVLTVTKSFVLNTMLMSAGELGRYGMLSTDVVLAPETGYYDHLPLVVDFRLRAPVNSRP